jgi:hypothetical protein
MVARIDFLLVRKQVLAKNREYSEPRYRKSTYRYSHFCPEDWQKPCIPAPTVQTTRDRGGELCRINSLRRQDRQFVDFRCRTGVERAIWHGKFYSHRGL